MSTSAKRKKKKKDKGQDSRKKGVLFFLRVERFSNYTLIKLGGIKE